MPRFYKHAVSLAWLLGLLLIWGSAEAQQILNIPFQNLRRAKLWTGLQNSGVHGPDRHGSRRASTEGVTYPGRNRLPGGIWGGRTWPGSNEWVQEYLLRNATARNLGTYIITRPDPAEYQPTRGTEFVLSFSGLTTSPDITPMTYPINQMIEGQSGVGFRTEHPVQQVPLGNWWAGQSPLPPDQVLHILNHDFARYMNPEHKRFGEALGIARWTTEAGITATKKIYQWGFRDYNDFIIVENIFENTGDSNGDGIRNLNNGQGLTLNDTYFSFYNFFWPTEAGVANHDGGVTPAVGYMYWILRRGEGDNYTLITDDIYRYTEAPNYGSAQPNHADLAEAGGMKMSYAFDWDSPFKTHDSTGDPHIPETQCCWGRSNFQIRGELLSGQYVGVLPLDWMPPFVNDDEVYVAPKVADQPFAAPWWPFKEHPEIERNSPDEIARALTSVPLPGERPSMNNLGGRTPFPVNPTQPLPVQSNPSLAAETPSTPASPNWYQFSHTYGPYDLNPGDKVKIVMAFVAAMPVRENIWAWQKDVPQNQQDLKTDKAMRNLILHAQRAREMYELGGDVPLPPPDPLVLKIDNTPDATARVTWKSMDDLENPDYAGTSEAKDIAGYRVYRSDFYLDDWKLLKDIQRGDAAHLDTGTQTYSFVDDTSVSGFEYYYAITAYSTGHSDYKGRGPVPSLESALGAPEQFLPHGYTPFSPAVAASAEANRLERPVAVIPNPFLPDGTHAYEGSDRIRFTNLPAKCNVKIFSVAGDLVGEFDHDDPALGEAAYFQLTRSVTGQIPAGVYFFVVQSKMPESMGKTQRGTFVVIGGSVR